MKLYEKITKKIRGVEYTAQFNGVEEALKLINEAQSGEPTDIMKLAHYVLDNVIVDPKREINDFEDTEELMEVVKFGLEVVHGARNFRSKKQSKG